jgi:hypothetical protein
MATSKFTTRDREILCNGTPFVAKGVCYSPVPIGGTFEWEPFGDVFVEYWKSIWQRDLDELQKMKANSLRLYTTSPYLKPNDPGSGLVDHTAFLDACAACGLYVWGAYAIDTRSYSDPNLWKITESGTAEMCKQMAQHPAVIGFIIGNELNGPAQREDPSWWEKMDRLGRIAKESQGGRDKLTMQCFIDDGMITPRLAATVGKGMPSIDVFGINAYRGTQTTGFGALFTDYAAVCPKPLLMTEFGCPASTHVPDQPYPQGQCEELPDNAAAQAEYVITHWSDIVAHRDVCSGGYVFEWCDEWWKQGHPVDQHKGSPAKAAPFPGGWWDDEWFGICSAAVNGRPPKDPSPAHPDVLTQRAVYKALQTSW